MEFHEKWLCSARVNGLVTLIQVNNHLGYQSNSDPSHQPLILLIVALRSRTRRLSSNNVPTEIKRLQRKHLKRNKWSQLRKGMQQWCTEPNMSYIPQESHFQPLLGDLTPYCSLIQPLTRFTFTLVFPQLLRRRQYSEFDIGHVNRTLCLIKTCGISSVILGYFRSIFLDVHTACSEYSSQLEGYTTTISTW